MTDRVGQQLGNYFLTRLLGEGGFAEVYLGEHIHLGTEAAIKVLHTQLTSEDLEKFRAEARTIARLKHRHIVRVLDFGVDGKTPFLVMDYAPNGTLRQRHSRGTPLPLTTVVSYVKQVADALQYAHDQKLIHRDIKPENMLLEPGDEVLLSDFGIAIVAQSSRYQGTQDLAGTIAYMAPEQIQAHPRPASDQYSLGVVIYEWLTGDRPFHGSFTEIAVKHTIVPPPSLREKVPTIPPDVEQVVMTTLAKDPHQRFASVRAFATALEQACQSDMPTYISPLPKPPPIPSPSLPSTQYAVPLSHPEMPPVVTPSPAPRLPVTEVPRTPIPPAKVSSPLGTTLYIYKGHSHNVEAVAWSPDSVCMASGDGSGKVQVWKASTGENIFASRSHRKWVSSLTWSPDGKYIASASHDQTVWVWNVTTGEIIFSYAQHTTPVSEVAWSPDGKYIASGSWNGAIHVWNANTGDRISSYRHSAALASSVRGVEVNAIAWSPDSTHIVSASSDKTVQIWNTSTRSHLYTYRGHSDTVLAVAWSPDGKVIASAGYDQTVQIWDTSNWNKIFKGHARIVRAVVWSPDSKYIASASSDETVQIWNTVTGVRTFSYCAHSGAVAAVAWSPDGRRIASAGRDKTVQIWQAV